MVCSPCVFLLFLFAVKTTKSQNIICVIPSPSSEGSTSGLSPACAGLEIDDNLTQIDDALLKLSANRNNTKLILLPGVHQISTFIYLELLSNVSISGQGAVENVEITCAPDVGLVIVNSRNLTIENVTVVGCGLRGEHLARVSLVAQEYVVLNPTYTLLTNIARAVVIIQCHSLTLEYVCIRDTLGVGLTGLNVLGDSLLKNVEFFNNSGSVETTPSYEDTAGGAVFFFGGSLSQDTMISDRNSFRIDDCRFRNSSSRSEVNRYILADDFFEITDFRAALNNGYAYPLDGAAGLSLIFAQQYKESQEVTIAATSFAHMIHPEGGCMLVLFQEPLSTISVTLDGVIFENCHGNESGGGLLVGFGYPTSYDAMDFGSIALHMPNGTNQTITVKNTEFRECNAIWGGGAAVLSVPTFLTRLKNIKCISFENCTWFRNRGTTGSALAIWEGKYHGVQKKFGFEVNLRSCNFTENGIEEIENAQQLNAAVVNLDAVEANFYGSTNFFDNKMSCIGATRSIINIGGTFKAERTQVISSGALDFRDTSFLVLREGAIVEFFSNQAVWRGGAIYVSASTPWPLTEFGLCALHFDRFQACPQQPCYTLSGDDTPFYRMNFVNNSAGMVGNDLYGTTFRHCPWVKPGQNGNEILKFLENELSDILRFSVNITDQESRNTINSLDTHVSFHSSTPLPQEIMPGEQWTARVTARDFYNQEVPLLTTLRLLQSENIKDFSIDGNVVAFIDDEDNKLTFEFLGEEGQTVTFQFLPIISFRPSNSFSFTFTDCKVGFIYNKTRRACICDELLLSLHPSIQCNPNGTISYGTQRWIGFRNNTFKNKGQYPYIYTTGLCIFDYCDESVILIENLSNISEQCNHNRAGTLCGRCREGYSRVLGSTACEICHSHTLWYLIFYFASGILIVTFIFTFQISISSGYLNGPIFYANVVSIFAASIYPTNVPRYQNIDFVIISFLNLDIGFQTCFYDGMTQLVYTGLKLTYPFYLLSIISSIALVAKYCPGKFLKMKSLKPVRAIATVLFISFTNIFQSVTRILAFAVLTYRGQNTEFTEFLWLHDPSVRYGSGSHGALVAVSGLLLVFILLPQVLLLAFYKPLQNVKCIKKRLQKWWPFFDAFQNPFIGRLRFWIGIQLLIRGLILIISCFQQLPSTSSITLREYSLFIVILILITYTILQAFLRPYKGWLRNILDLIFLLDLIYLLSTALYYNILRVSNQNEVELIQDLHFKFVQFCQVSAITLASFIFAGFICARVGLVRYCYRNLLPKMPPKLQTTVIAALKDASYKIGANAVGGHNKPNRLLNPSSTSTTVVLNDGGSDSELELQADYTRYRESILEQESIIS